MSSMGRFEIWAHSEDPAIDAALKNLAIAINKCSESSLLNGIEQRLVRFGSSASSHADQLRQAEAKRCEQADAAREERNKRARERRQKKLLETPFSSIISDKLARRR